LAPNALPYVRYQASQGPGSKQKTSTEGSHTRGVGLKGAVALSFHSQALHSPPMLTLHLLYYFNITLTSARA